MMKTDADVMVIVSEEEEKDDFGLSLIYPGEVVVMVMIVARC